jgi:predicted amidohydrolase
LKAKIVLVQANVKVSKEENIRSVKNLLSKNKKKKIDLIVLSEMFNCPYSNKYFLDFAESFPSATYKFLSETAKSYSSFLIGGSIPEKEGSKIYNTSLIFDRDGKLIAKHRKLHLFDIDIKDKIRFKESDIFSKGNNITVFDTDFAKIGIAICYDMRFPELIRKMTLMGAEIIAVPAAFNMVTGPAHWHLTVRARAVDNQIYFIASSPASYQNNIYKAYGHSLIADPWGKIIADAGTGQKLLIKNIDLEMVARTRMQLPLLSHRREDIY